jgi:hypothetical protein
MISSFRHSFYSIGAVVLLLCLTGVSVRAQEAVEVSRERTVVKQQTEGKPEAASSSSKDVVAHNETESGLSASSGSTTAPVPSRAAPLPVRGKHLRPSRHHPARRDPRISGISMFAPYCGWPHQGAVGVGDLTTDIDPGVSTSSMH